MAWGERLQKIWNGGGVLVRIECADGEEEHWPDGEVQDHCVRGSVWRCVEWLWPWGVFVKL